MKRRSVLARHLAIALQETPPTAPLARDSILALLAIPAILFLGFFMPGFRGG
ncbi:MAG: hypothetical protein JOZ19_10410 [Rubrobacter sp.]|nr:hypothetical protein [Rubrobacter sp.]